MKDTKVMLKRIALILIGLISIYIYIEAILHYNYGTPLIKFISNNIDLSISILIFVLVIIISFEIKKGWNKKWLLYAFAVLIVLVSVTTIASRKLVELAVDNRKEVIKYIIDSNYEPAPVSQELMIQYNKEFLKEHSNESYVIIHNDKRILREYNRLISSNIPFSVILEYRDHDVFELYIIVNDKRLLRVHIRDYKERRLIRFY